MLVLFRSVTFRRRSAENGFTFRRRSAEHGFTSLRRSAEHGFTTGELMVVIVIIGLLATIVAVNVLPATGKARTEKAKADIATLEQALDQYRLDNITYPNANEGLQALVTPPPTPAQPERYRSEARRVGKEGGSKCRSRGSP